MCLRIALINSNIMIEHSKEMANVLSQTVVRSSITVGLQCTVSPHGTQVGEILNPCSIEPKVICSTNSSLVYAMDSSCI